MADAPPGAQQADPKRDPSSRAGALADGERLFRFGRSSVGVEPANLNSPKRGQPNRVSTTKFTPLTWLPLSLFYQFQRIANVYFLFVAIIVVCLGDESPKSWTSKVFPFLGVLLWTALKDAYEDLGRHRDDQEENCRKCLRYVPATGAFEEVGWQKVLAGDLLYVVCDGAFPADLLLMQAYGGHEAFISTVNLDGETNLKERRPPTICSGICERTLGKERTSHCLGVKEQNAERTLALEVARGLATKPLSIRMGKPEVALAEVRGRLSLDETECCAGETNFLPRGCVLRNTIWVLAIAAYVGDETKTKLNAMRSTQKISNMQRYLNGCVQGLLVALIIVVLFCATMAQILDSDDDGWGLKFLKYCVAFYHVVPVSLYVMFEMMKLLLGYQVNTDQQMFDPDSGKGAVARTADLMEELGQVDFLFSDKTGTLTANEMVFARCSVAGHDPGDFRKADDSQPGLSSSRRILGAPGDPLHESMSLFFTCLAICHSVQVEEREEMGIETQRLVYSGMSPDEVSLVQAAHDAGLAFQRRERDSRTGASELQVSGPGPAELRSFTVLHELEFNSDRKRMSVVVKYKDEIWCVTKGADNVMANLMEVPLDRDTADSLKRFSQQGLRTLLIGMKKVDPQYLERWSADLRAAENTVDASKNDRIAEVSARIETSLRLVGVTAVEDRLQAGVPQAIKTVKECGIRAWVLTGDKVETAVDIAMSCQLFTVSTKLVYATECVDCQEALKKLRRARDDLAGESNGGLVLDGRTVGFALEDKEARDLVYDLGLASRSCVCCRLSPMQKRRLVELVRLKNPTTITLAIGDGANDVPMLEGAHIGVGVRGKEGMQAVQVSDIAISQFRFLVPLLLCHGRRSYRRVAHFLCYYLYKNVTLVVSDIVWTVQDSFRGQIAYPEFMSMGFNVLFTSVHILFVLGFDVGVPDAVATCHPELYHEGPKRMLFNPSVFAVWMCYAIWHGCVVWLVPNLSWGGTEYTETPSSFWSASCTSFLITVLVVNIRLLTTCVSPFSQPAILSTLASWASTVLVLFFLGETSLGYGLDNNAKMEGIPTDMFSDGKVWLALFLTPLLALSVDFTEKLVRRIFFPTALDRLLRKVRAGGKRQLEAVGLERVRPETE